MDNDSNVDTDNIEIDPAVDSMSIRGSIEQALSKETGNSEPELDTEEDSVEEDASTEEVQEEPQDAEEAPAPVETPTPAAEERIPLVPPADMNAMEKEAFLNPTPANSHILQQYMNRRAYETRADYQRRVEEVENLRKQTSSMYDSIKQYEKEYAKDGINIGDVAKRFIEWDVEMQKNPVEVALDWLDSYGLTVDQLVNAKQGYGNQQMPNQYQGYQPQQAQYLTREEAERIAEEKLQASMARQQEEQRQKSIAYYNDRAVESFKASRALFRDPETASQLEAEMAPIVQALAGTGRYSSPEQILETAYNYVVSGNPTFSSLHQGLTAKPKLEQQAAEAKKAKAASRSITGSVGTGTPRIVTKDIRDNLRRRLGGD